MKEHIISISKIIVFLILFFILCITMNYLCNPVISGDTEIVNGFYGERENSLDVVYLGGSASFVYYQPLKAYKEYGITSYDFGANTMQAELYPYMINEVYKKQNPKLLIIDARAFQYRDSEQPPTEVAYRNVLSATPLSINKAKFIEKNVRRVLKENNTLSYYFSFIKFHSAEGKYSKTQALKMMTHKFKHPYKGFMFIPKVEKEEYIDYETDEVQAPSIDTIFVLNELLDTLKEKDTKVLFVVSPYVERKEDKKIYNYVEKRVKDAGFDFIDANDYRDEMKINYSTDFYNPSHVNIYGSNKYTDFINNYIKNNLNLIDHRKEKVYDSWNELIEKWDADKQIISDETDKEKELIEKND